MIGQRPPADARELLRQFLRAATRRAIDDSALAAMGVKSFDELASGVCFRPHSEKKVGPIE